MKSVMGDGKYDKRLLRFQYAAGNLDVITPGRDV